jgi:hypothetical protein
MLNFPLAEPKPAATAANDNDPTKAGKFTVTLFEELGTAKPKSWIVKGVRAAGEFSYTVAKPGGGKSVIEGDIAYHIAAGRDWHGHKVEQGLAVYFAAERKKLQEYRAMALRQQYGDNDIPLVIVGGKPDLTSNITDAKAMAIIIEVLEKHYGLPCRHVTIDTLARSFGGGDQNAGKDMMAFVRSVDHLMERFPTAHVNAIHHEGWETGRSKGAIDLDGAVDASFKVTKTGDTFKLICDGTNDGVEGDILSFTMRSVDLGEDEDGEPISAPIVVQAADIPAMAAKAKSVQAQAESDAMAIITELAVGGHPVGGGMWMAKYRELFPDEKPNTVESRWKRAVRALEDDGRVHPSGRPKVYTLAGVHDGVQAPDALAPCTNDPSDRQGAKVQVHLPFRGCTNAPAPAEGLDDDELTDGDNPVFLHGAA